MSNTDISPYELQRLERIKKNEAYLESLGLKQHKSKMLEMTKKTKRNQQRARTQKAVKPGEERRSSRGSKKGTKNLVMLSYQDPDDIASPSAVKQNEYYSETYSPTSVMVTPSPTFRASRLSLNREDFALSAEEKNILSKNTMDSNYLQKFEEFLVYHNKISEQNKRNVMRQVTKLATGQGVRYESARYGWKPDQYFRKGQRVTPLSDFVELLDQARDAENRWGRDHGNGWLLSHPLKKMLLFQQFCLQNPDFLSSDCKLREYYAQDEEIDEEVDDSEEVVETSEEVVETNEDDEDSSESETDDGEEVVETSEDDDDQDSAESETAKQKRERNKEFVGCRVAKDFEGTVYEGTVQRYQASSEFWFVVYDDGDEEEMEESELQEARDLFEQNSKKKEAMTTPRKRGRPRKNNQAEEPPRKRGRPRKDK